MNTKHRRDIAEISVAKILLSKGYSVSFPFGDNERYDLIFDDGEKLRKVQVRHAVKREGYLVFKCYSNHRKHGKINRETFDKKEIDEFIVWNEKIDSAFRIPVSEAPETEMRLRINSTGNNQSENINWAEDYEI